ncbi:MAG TPA: hypothetical protein VFK41_07800 [Nocardioidaceae bacterium]|nr:hypothetical protein [Nocardioidaceae bacterium]
MRHTVSRARRIRARRNQRGAVALITAFVILGMLVVAAMVLDFGLVRVDRQVNKSAADAAATAGLYGLAGGDGLAHPYMGVCQALRYLSTNDDRFSSVTDTSGSWTNGAGAATGNGCTNSALRAGVCTPGDATSWARFVWNGTIQGDPIRVTIQSGYQMSGSGFIEEDLTAVQADQGDGAQQGCDQLAVLITQNRDPGLGSLATSSDLVSTIRTVGRVKQVPGGNAPAMLLLRRTGCPSVQVGSAGGGADSWIRVFGATSSDGRTTPGTIHADTDGLNCSGGGAYVFYGKAAGGIVAYAAPLASNPSTPDPTQPGRISALARANGVAMSTVRDSLANVYGSSALNNLATGTSSEVTGLPLVTRRIVDDRYLGSASSPTTGVKGAIADAQSAVFSLGTTGVTNGNYVSQGFTHFINLGNSNCTTDQATINGMNLTASSRLWIRCGANGGFRPGNLTINAGTVVVTSKVAPTGNFSMPNAKKVYIFGSSSEGLDMGNGSGFAMNTATNLTGSSCSAAQDTDTATLFIKDGSVKQTGGSLQLCYTTVFLMGGSSTGCTPATHGTAPTMTPCGGTIGSGQYTQTGGNVDWTAPNTLDITTDMNGDPLPAAEAAWKRKDGPEDLALWAESGSSSSATYNMAGGGTFTVRGVYMMPNAQPLVLSGGASMGLVNAQFIASTLELNGGTDLGMRVDPNSAVTLPKLDLVGLVR